MRGIRAIRGQFPSARPGLGSFTGIFSCQMSTCTVQRQLALLEDEQMDQHIPSILGQGIVESDLGRNLGFRRQRNVKLEASVRMLADNLILYETMDQVFNKRRLELFDYKNFVEPATEEHSSVASAVNPNEYTVLGVNEPLLRSLDMNALNEAHNYMAKTYNAMSSKSFSHYLNEALAVSYSGPYLQPYQRNIQKSSEGWHGVYYNVYKQERFAATAAMNKRLMMYGKDKFYTQGHNYNSLLQSHPNYLSGIAEILMTSGALPDLKTFNILIRQFNLSRLSAPARMVLDALILSELPMNNLVYNTALRLAISTGDKEGFMQLSRVFDFNSVTVADGTDSPLDEVFWNRFHPIKMSSYRNHDWPAPRPEDEALRTRFFSSASNNSTDSTSSRPGRQGMHSTQIYTTLITGMVRFGWHWWIDVAIRKMAAEGFPLTLEVLTLNMEAAADTKDAAKARWTWSEILNLPLPTPGNEGNSRQQSQEQEDLLHQKDKNGFKYRMVPFDKEAYLTCMRAARAVNDKALVKQIEGYYREFQVYQIQLQIELQQLKKSKKSVNKERRKLPFFSPPVIEKPAISYSDQIDQKHQQPQQLELLQRSSKRAYDEPLYPHSINRVALRTSIKNVSSYLFGGNLVWNSQFASGTQEGGSITPKSITSTNELATTSPSKSQSFPLSPALSPSTLTSRSSSVSSKTPSSPSTISNAAFYPPSKTSNNSSQLPNTVYKDRPLKALKTWYEDL